MHLLCNKSNFFFKFFTVYFLVFKDLAWSCIGCCEFCKVSLFFFLVCGKKTTATAKQTRCLQLSLLFTLGCLCFSWLIYLGLFPPPLWAGIRGAGLWVGVARLKADPRARLNLLLMLVYSAIT